MKGTKLDLPARESVVILAVDAARADGTPERRYLLGRGADVEQTDATKFQAWTPGAALPTKPGAGDVFVFVYPTKTYSEGFGGDGGSDISPEDRAMIRVVARRARRLTCVKVGATAASVAQSQREKAARSLVKLDLKYLRDVKPIFESCMTKPNKQDFIYLATKSFGLNLIVRLAFAIKAVSSGHLPMVRGVAVTSWYQLQDCVFTIFGQTYMKFLGKMTGLLRVGNIMLGDFLFVYFQMVGFEFLNRLVLGPVGENPLVYTWQGIGLIFANILQGLISGGPLVPALNQMRRVGAIKHSTMMHLYQFSGLTLQFGLFASFGYQKIYAALTGGTLLFSWGGYAIFSLFYKDPEFAIIENADTLARLAKLAKI